MCQAQEAAKKQRATIQQGPSHLHDSVAALKTQKPFTPPWMRSSATSNRSHTMPCISCVMSQLGHFSRVCRSKPVHPNETKPPWPSTSTLQSAQPDTPFVEQTGVSNIHHVTSTDPTPKLKIDISALNETITTTVLPDSGADISAAGTSILSQLNERIGNLYLPLLFPKLRMELKCTLSAGCQYVSRPGTKNTMMTSTFTLMLQAHWCPGRHARNVGSYQIVIPIQSLPTFLPVLYPVPMLPLQSLVYLQQALSSPRVPYRIWW